MKPTIKQVKQIEEGDNFSSPTICIAYDLFIEGEKFHFQTREDIKFLESFGE